MLRFDKINKFQWNIWLISTCVCFHDATHVIYTVQHKHVLMVYTHFPIPERVFVYTPLSPLSVRIDGMKNALSYFMNGFSGEMHPFFVKSPANTFSTFSDEAFR